MEKVEDERTEAPGRRVSLQARISREIHFKAKDLFKSHGLTMDRGVEWALRAVLLRAGIQVSRDHGVNKKD